MTLAAVHDTTDLVWRPNRLGGPSISVSGPYGWSASVGPVHLYGTIYRWGVTLGPHDRSLWIGSDDEVATKREAVNLAEAFLLDPTPVTDRPSMNVRHRAASAAAELIELSSPPDGAIAAASAELAAALARAEWVPPAEGVRGTTLEVDGVVWPLAPDAWWIPADFCSDIRWVVLATGAAAVYTVMDDKWRAGDPAAAKVLTSIGFHEWGQRGFGPPLTPGTGYTEPADPATPAIVSARRNRSRRSTIPTSQTRRR